MSADAGADLSDGISQVAEHHTGTRHLIRDLVATRDRQEIADGRPVTQTYGAVATLCGQTLHGAKLIETPLLETFPEDFGTLDVDCARCEAAATLK